MIGLEIGKVRIVAHDPAWSTSFQAERSALLQVLKALNVKPVIEHVGSTSVPGLVAKPIVDVAIGFASVGDVQHGLALLVRSGLQYVKGANQPGMLFMASGQPGQRSFHYHLVQHGTPAWRKLIVFRDYLRRHPGAAKEYGALKQRLAERCADSRQAYAQHKRPILRAIMQRGFADEERRRHAGALHLAHALADEDAALRAWWQAGHGVAPWSQPPMRSEATADSPPFVPASTAVGDDPDPPAALDLDSFDPGADA